MSKEDGENADPQVDGEDDPSGRTGLWENGLHEGIFELPTKVEDLPRCFFFPEYAGIERRLGLWDLIPLKLQIPFR